MRASQGSRPLGRSGSVRRSPQRAPGDAAAATAGAGDSPRALRAFLKCPFLARPSAQVSGARGPIASPVPVLSDWAEVPQIARPAAAPLLCSVSTLRLCVGPRLGPHRTSDPGQHRFWHSDGQNPTLPAHVPLGNLTLNKDGTMAGPIGVTPIVTRRGSERTPEHPLLDIHRRHHRRARGLPFVPHRVLGPPIQGERHYLRFHRDRWSCICCRLCALPARSIRRHRRPLVCRPRSAAVAGRPSQSGHRACRHRPHRDSMRAVLPKVVRKLKVWDQASGVPSPCTLGRTRQ